MAKYSSVHTKLLSLKTDIQGEISDHAPLRSRLRNELLEALIQSSGRRNRLNQSYNRWRTFTATINTADATRPVAFCWRSEEGRIRRAVLPTRAPAEDSKLSLTFPLLSRAPKKSKKNVVGYFKWLYFFILPACAPPRAAIEGLRVRANTRGDRDNPGRPPLCGWHIALVSADWVVGPLDHKLSSRHLLKPAHLLWILHPRAGAVRLATRLKRDGRGKRNRWLIWRPRKGVCISIFF